MDALDRFRQVNVEIADIVLRLGQTMGLLAATERESERLKLERKTLEDARRQKEAEAQELWKAVSEGGSNGGGRAAKKPSVNPVVQLAIDFLRDRGSDASAKDVARHFKIDDHNARQRLSKALKTGQVKRTSRGRYAYSGSARAAHSEMGQPATGS